MRAWLAAGALVLAGSGCRHDRPSRVNGTGAIATDSLIGIVSITGTSFEQSIVLRTPAGAVALRPASADDSLALTRVGGAEVIAYGATTRDRFAMTRFVVRSIDGEAVVDGVLVREGNRLLLRTRDHDFALANPPSALDSLVGARLWIGGPLDTGPNVYGVMRPPSR